MDWVVDVPTLFSKGEAAQWFEAQGARCKRFRGHWWVRRPSHLGGAPGYWSPVDLIEPLPAEAIDWPSQTALGYRAVVSDAAVANVRSKWIVVPRMRGFGPHLLGRDRARRVRQTLSRYDFRKLSDPQVLLDQGFEVSRRSADRTGQIVANNRRAFAREIQLRFDADPQLVIAAFSGDELVGFALSYGVGQTVHFTDVCTTDEALRGKVSDGLYWCTLSTWARVPGVEQVVLGMYLDERPGLLPYKRTFGAGLVELPMVGQLRRPVAAYLRTRRPLSYARLAGENG